MTATKLKKQNYPFEIEGGVHYVPSFNALNRVYTQHPEFKANTKLIYELLFDYYNPDYGYAFPTYRQLERDSGLSISTVKRQVKVLEQLELIEIGRSSYGNNVYVVKPPLQTIEELFAKFPEIEQKAKERLAKIEQEEEQEKSRRKKASEKGEVIETEKEIQDDFF